MSTLLDCTIRVSVILAIALLAVRLCHARSAALRHWILVIAMCAAAITPGLTLVVPHWSPLPIIQADQVPPPMIGNSARVVIVATAPRPAWSPNQILLLLWAAGAVIAFAVLVAGALRLGRIAERSEPVFLGNWVTVATELSGRYGLRRQIRLLQSDHGSFLVTWGGMNPRVLLPVSAEGWPEDRIRVVLSHELAHVRRWDWPVQMMAELLRAAYWFNPLVWIACNRLKQESEHACDDAALNLGIAGTDYATHLLELARILKHSRRAWSPGLAIARPSTLERRFTAMLNPVLDRQKVTRPAILGIAIAALCITLPLAALQSTVQAQSQAQATPVSGRITGTVSDASGAAVARATIIISTPDGRTQDIAATMANGSFGFPGLPAGQYVLQVFATGFGPSRMTNIELAAGKDLKQDLRMDIGFVQNNIVRVNPAPVVSTPTVPRGFSGLAPLPRPAPATISAATPNNPAPATAPIAQPRIAAGDSGNSETPAVQKVRMGGNVMKDNNLIPESQTKPVYPALAKQARIQGVVILEADIDSQGRVTELHVISGHPLLQQAAIDAVSTWRYKPVMLNGAPVGVVTTVTVNFSFAQ